MDHTARAKGQPATLISRLGAGLYDGFILFGLAFLVFIPITLIEQQAGAMPIWVKTVVLATVAYGYFVGFWVKAGTTTGMRPWKLRLAMNGSGNPVDMAAATMRFLVLMVTWIALLGIAFILMRHELRGMLFMVCAAIPLASMLCMLFSTSRQPLHDLLAGTNMFRVVSDE